MGHRYSAFDCPCNGKVLEKSAKLTNLVNLARSRRQLVKNNLGIRDRIDILDAIREQNSNIK